MSENEDPNIMLGEQERRLSSLKESIKRLKDRKARLEQSKELMKHFEVEFSKHFTSLNTKDVSVTSLRKMIKDTETWSGVEFIETEAVESHLKILGRKTETNTKFSFDLTTALGEDKAKLISDLKLDIDGKELTPRIKRACRQNSINYVIALIN